MTELDAIRAAAPEWANYLCVTKEYAFPFWQDNIDPACPAWGVVGTKYDDTGLPLDAPELRGTAISLITGSVYIRKGKKVVEVTRAEWEAMP